MSRTSTTIILGGALGLVVGILAVAVLFFGRSLFTITDSQTTFDTPPAVVTTGIPASVTSQPTGTNTATPTVTAAVPTTGSTVAATQAAATTAPVATIAVSTTSVEYVQAQVDVNIRTGPGTGYSIVGYIAAGQTARVTGVNGLSGWWRVVCPDGSTGSCWVSGSTQFTKATNGPVVPVPTAAPTTAGCFDRAALLADVTVPDNTQFGPTTGFNKTWRLKNSGTCTWENGYQVVHAGGHLMGAVSSVFPLNQTVAPGQTADITINMVSPATTGVFQSDWKLQNAKGQVFGLGANGAPFYVKIIVTNPEPTTTIAGVVYQDMNQNGVYDNGEPLMANREVRLTFGPACHVISDAIATTLSGNDGVYTFKGNYNGSFCVGLSGSDGLEDVIAVNVTSGQVFTTGHLKAFIPNGSISGFVWNDYCYAPDGSGDYQGNCIPDANGGFRADGMVQPTETNIAGVTVLLKLGGCANNNNVPVAAVTGANGGYTFNSLQPATYCIYIDATSVSNQALLLPGVFTFPYYNVWYHELTISAGENVYSVNFGWDYQFN